MALIVSDSGGNYETHPSGLAQGVCCDVIDRGIIETEFGKKPCVSLAWQTDEKTSKGEPFTVQRRYTLSLNEKATLRRDLEAWRGRAFTADELRGFDLEKLLGANCWLNIVHATKPDGKTFANVASIVPLKKGTPLMTVLGGYVRVKDREPQGEHVTHTTADVPPPPDDSPVDDSQCPF